MKALGPTGQVLPYGVAVTLALAVTADVGAAADSSPVRRIDRMWAVGAPVLTNPTARSGVYVWIEDRALQVAARAGRSGRGRFRVRIRSTAAVDVSDLGDFTVISKPSANEVLLETRVRDRVSRGKVASEGDVTVSDVTSGAERRARLFVGPLARKAASSVLIGRF